ncbi:uncharacterized protein VTP21DRAFT_2632 [Calcarisporiella thermophila]|uniref:uncharacterized protein n=1 Tax=Calcarisporiella thermophila TaxID=911321 RepID=UPI0037430ADE
MVHPLVPVLIIGGVAITVTAAYLFLTELQPQIPNSWHRSIPSQRQRLDRDEGERESEDEWDESESENGNSPGERMGGSIRRRKRSERIRLQTRKKEELLEELSYIRAMEQEIERRKLELAAERAALREEEEKNRTLKHSSLSTAGKDLYPLPNDFKNNAVDSGSAFEEMSDFREAFSSMEESRVPVFEPLMPSPPLQTQRTPDSSPTAADAVQEGIRSPLSENSWTEVDRRSSFSSGSWSHA